MDEKPDAIFEEFRRHKVCVIIPTYNNEKTLAKLIDGVLGYSRDVIVVNDGATDGTAELLKAFRERVTLVVHPRNRGKGMAIRNGFQKAIEMGFDYAITIDSDGQHFPEDLPGFLEKSIQNPDALIMGDRNMTQKGIPAKSSFGNKFSSFWYYIETGIRLPDTQTGYRLYPLNSAKRKRYFTTGFEFEIEVIVRMAWMFVPVISLPVKVKYDPTERVSHFKPGRDFVRISVLNTCLVFLMLFWHLHVRMIRKIWKKGLWATLRDEFVKNTGSPVRTSAAVGFGIFMGIVPLWGFQMLVAAALAKLMRLNVIIVLVSSNISIPPMIPLLLFLSYWTGGIFLSDSIAIDWNSELTLDAVYLNLRQYLVGSVLFATAAGIAMFFLTFCALLFFGSRKNRV